MAQFGVGALLWLVLLVWGVLQHRIPPIALAGAFAVNTITFFAYWIVGLPIAYFLGVKTGVGVKGIWYGLTLGLLTSSILLYFRYRHIIRKREKDMRTSLINLNH